MMREPTQDDLRGQYDADEAVLFHDMQTLLPIPTDVHQFGETIEHVKLMLSAISSHTSTLKELSAAYREVHTKAVRGDKATLNDKDKKEIAWLCAEDEALCSVEQRIKMLDFWWTRWDARRSRLHRDFEVASIDYRHRLAMALLDSQTRHADEQRQADQQMLRDTADYEATRRRQST